MEDDQMEDDQKERRPKWKTTKMEDNQNVRQTKWKTTKMQDDQNVIRPKWKTTNMEDDQITTFFVTSMFSRNDLYFDCFLINLLKGFYSPQHTNDFDK